MENHSGNIRDDLSPAQAHSARRGQQDQGRPLGGRALGAGLRLRPGRSARAVGIFAVAVVPNTAAAVVYNNVARAAQPWFTL
jgi:hypothetical protein